MIANLRRGREGRRSAIVTVAKSLQGAVLSFFDEGDEPRTAIGSPPPRRRPVGRSQSSRRGPADERTVIARRAGAIAIAVVVLAIVYFGFRAYESSQNTQALKNYVSEVTTLVDFEQQQIADPVFNRLIGAPGTTGQQLQALQAALEQDAVTARQEAQTAAGWSVPSSVAGAQQNLLTVLDMRTEALSKIQNYVTPALKTSSIPAIKDIAGAMDIIYASDILYDVRVVPLIHQALVADGIQVAGGGFGGTLLPPTKPFLPDQSWTIAGYVQGKILGETSPELGGTLGAGTHGHKIIGVQVGTTQLTNTSSIQQVPYTPGMTFTVTFDNDGENDEFGVITQVTLYSASTKELIQQAETKETLPGQQATVPVPINGTPVIGTTLLLTATVEPVPGEKEKSNNTLRYYVQFTRS
jgi:hypothetical protein